MKQTAVLLFITLLLFGCTSVPKKGTEKSAEAVPEELALLIQGILLL